MKDIILWQNRLFEPNDIFLIHYLQTIGLRQAFTLMKDSNNNYFKPSTDDIQSKKYELLNFDSVNVIKQLSNKYLSDLGLSLNGGCLNCINDARARLLTRLNLVTGYAINRYNFIFKETKTNKKTEDINLIFKYIIEKDKEEKWIYGY